MADTPTDGELLVDWGDADLPLGFPQLDENGRVKVAQLPAEGVISAADRAKIDGAVQRAASISTRVQGNVNALTAMTPSKWSAS